jgi:hypothetical protein
LRLFNGVNNVFLPQSGSIRQFFSKTRLPFGFHVAVKMRQIAEDAWHSLFLGRQPENRFQENALEKPFASKYFLQFFFRFAKPHNTGTLVVK